MRIIVTAGYNRSRHSIALMHDLRESGHEIVGCVQVKTIQLKRFKAYIKQFGWKTVKAKFKSHVLGSENSYLSNEIKPIQDYFVRKKITFSRTTSFCKMAGIHHIKVNSINNKKFERFLSKNKVDIIVYAGGGIIRKNIIEKSKYGVLNAHSGWLPFFRGMNVIEWALLYGFRPYTTIHLIDVGIDTGNILYREAIPLENNLYTIRGMATLHNVELIVKVINNFTFYLNSSVKQSVKKGKQFFVMHDRLKKLVSIYLNKNYDSLEKKLKTTNTNELHFK